MASRQEEKEKRRRERLERERAEQAAAKRKRLLGIVGGTVVAAAIVVGVALAVSGGGGGEDGERASDSAVASAARAAGCVYRTFPSEGSTHVSQPRTAKDYKTNPPTSGDHNDTPAPDGLYAPGNEPEITNWVHTLEHGRVILMYDEDAPQDTVAALQRLFEEPVLDEGPSYHMVLMRNNSDMPFRAAAVAWRHYIGCNDVTPQSITAMREFRDRWVDQGPEKVP